MQPVVFQLLFRYFLQNGQHPSANPSDLLKSEICILIGLEVGIILGQS